MVNIEQSRRLFMIASLLWQYIYHPILGVDRLNGVLPVADLGNGNDDVHISSVAQH